jgi:hypothetical protein
VVLERPTQVFDHHTTTIRGLFTCPRTASL